MIRSPSAAVETGSTYPRARSATERPPRSYFIVKTFSRFFVKMNSKYFPRISRTATITLAAAIALVTITGCFGSPRANDTVAGAAIGAGTGALIGGAEGSPGTGALLGGVRWGR